MRPTRGTILAALVLVAVAAPVAAYSLDDAPSSRADRSEQSEHPGKGHDKGDAKGHDKDGDKSERPGRGEKPEKAEKGSDRPDDPSAAGRAHAQAMKEWTRCVADAASGPKPAGALELVAPRMTTRKTAVSTTSISRAETML